MSIEKLQIVFGSRGMGIRQRWRQAGLLLLAWLAGKLGAVVLPVGWLMFDPALAKEIGINQAVILQKVTAWVEHNAHKGRNHRRGKTWSYNSVAAWQQEFTWLHQKTVGKYLRELEAAGRLESAFLSPRKGDRTKWYTVKKQGAKDSNGRNQRLQWWERLIPMMGAKRGDESTKDSSSIPASTKAKQATTIARGRGKAAAVGKAPRSFPKGDLPEQRPAKPEPIEARDEHEPRETPPPVPRAPLPASKEREAWEIAYGQLTIQLDRANFDNWLRGATFIGFNAETNTFQIGVGSPYAREMLAGRLYRDIRRVVSDVHGAPVELRFVVAEKPAEVTEEEVPIFRLLARQAREETEKPKPLGEEMAEFGFRLTEDEIEALRWRYGEERLRQEMEYARRGNFRNPAGFVLYQLGREAGNGKRADG